jgi:hypothetical protein
LKAVEIARTRAALVIHPDNPVRNARLEGNHRLLGPVQSSMSSVARTVAVATAG